MLRQSSRYSGYFSAARLREMAYKKHFSTVDTKTLLGSSYNPPLLGVVVKFRIMQLLLRFDEFVLDCKTR